MRQTDKFISIDNIVTAIRDKQANKYDCKIVISGWLGKGKSTLGYQLGKRITDDFAIPNNYIFEASEETIGRKVLELKKSAIVIDEAIDVLYKMDWASDLQNALINLMTKTRHRRHAIIMCIPYFTELRRSFRNNLVDFWIHIPRRGAAIAFGKTPCIYDDDPWHMKENAKKFWDSTKGVSYLELIGDTDKQVELYEKTPGCIGYFTFDPMPEDDQKDIRHFIRSRKGQVFRAVAHEEQRSTISEGDAKAGAGNQTAEQEISYDAGRHRAVPQPQAAECQRIHTRNGG